MKTVDIFLSPDERFDVWKVKSAERPHLLLCQDIMGDEANNGGVDDEDSIEEFPLPLLDGCDLPGWRKSQLVTLSNTTSSVLNVGTGCSMFRRESQLPVLSSSSIRNWNKLKERFMQEPPAACSPQRIPKHEAIQLSFHPWFERDNVPVLLEGLADDWKAMQTCRWDELVRNYGDYYWRFSDTHGACMTLNTYHKYVNTLEGMTDDAPLAVYDSQLDGDDRASLLDDYEVPSCFASPDLFEGLGEDGRPPYRWILMGPARSGTGLHIDPMGTHAWVTVIEGLKRWVLFPYGTDKQAIGMQDPQIQSALWFEHYYDRVVQQIPGAIEVLQRPGETVYVPAGWPHLVLNLEPTVAITQNYATEFPTMDRISTAVIEEEPDLHSTWIRTLAQSRPELEGDLRIEA